MRIRLTLVFFCALALLFVLTVGIAHLPILRVQSVVVSGVETMSTSTIEAFVQARLKGYYGYVFPKNNIFLYPREAIIGDLARTYSLFLSVDVFAEDFQTVAVHAVERKPNALWCTANNSGRVPCYFMDENGIVYAEAPLFSEPVYVSYYGPAVEAGAPKQYLTRVEFQELSALVDAFTLQLKDQKILSVSVDAERDVHVVFASGFKVLFGLTEASGDVFERFTVAFEHQPLADYTLADVEYLDLRFGDKLYYKLKYASEKVASSTPR
jgi:cell division septal protein FtsQ